MALTGCRRLLRRECRRAALSIILHQPHQLVILSATEQFTIVRLILANTGVTAGSYGLAGSVPQITFDSKGRATLAANVAISITASQVSDFTSAVQAIIDGSGAAANVGDGESIVFAVTHNLNSRDVIVQIYDNTTYDTIYTDVVRTSVNVVTITFATAPASNRYRVLVQRVS